MTASQKLRALVASLAIIGTVATAPAQDAAYFRMNPMMPASVVTPPMPSGPPSGGNPTTPTVPTTPTQPEEPQQQAEASFAQSAFAGKRSVALATAAPTTNLAPPVAWSLAPASAELPPGLSLDPATGIVAGKPSQAGIFPGIALRAASGPRNATTSPTTFAIVSPSISYAFTGLTEGKPAAIEAAASNLAAPAVFEIDPAGSALPAGLGIERETGRISGQPAAPATVSGLRIRVTDADGATADAGPYAFTVAALVIGDAAGTLPANVTFSSGPLAGSSRRNVGYLLGQYVPDAKPTLAPGQSVEIAYADPVKVDGVHMFALPSASSFRVDAEIGGQWQVIRTGMAQVGGNAAPLSLGRTVTTSRLRIVNTGSQTLTNLTAGPSFSGKWAQLPVVTQLSRGVRLSVGQSFSAGTEVYTGPQGYGTIVFRAPFTFSIVNPGTIPYYPDAAFQLPAGFILDAATGTVSGTATAKTLFEGKAPNGVPFSTKQAVHYIVVTDADGYQVYGSGRSMTVE